MLVQVSAGTWSCDTLCHCWPSTYQRSWLGVTDRSHSKRYVWNADWQDAPGHSRNAAMPVLSLHGPPGLTPQCSTPQTRFMPLTFSMMSSSPMPGQFHQLPRYGLPNAQNAGQYPSALSPVTLGI